jgi:hypothetical protein
MATKKKMLQAAAGQAGGEPGLDIDEVFSTYLYEGNASTQTITNGIDLAGEGGMVWLKSRSHNNSHEIDDTERGVGKLITPNSTAAEVSQSEISAFNSDGFDLRYQSGRANADGEDIVSWTFRKSPKFFDVVTFVGDGTAGKTVSHNLGSVPGMIWVKGIDVTDHWHVYHRGVTAAADKYLVLNDTGAATDSVTVWNDIEPTDTEFTLGNNGGVNGNGSNYVAYLFAHNNSDGGFGPDGDQDIIKCGNYTGNGSTDGPVIDLGFEPQWLLIKRTSGSEEWLLFDIMRGIPTGGYDPDLRPAQSNAENTDRNWLDLTSTGFQPKQTSNHINGNGENYIYIAIRRGPLAPPESATEVFDVSSYSSNGNSNIYNTGFNADMNINTDVTTATDNYIIDRLRGDPYLKTNDTGPDASGTSTFWSAGNNLLDIHTAWWAHHAGVASWSWKRAPGFFDVVAYTGNYTAGRTVSHNLGVAPEMIWVKDRDQAKSWQVYLGPLGLSGGAPAYAVLNEGDAAAYSTTRFYATPTATEFSVGVNSRVNWSGDDYIAYLFASLPGISKVGSYTGNGSSQTIDCGFTSGARFVIVKPTSTSGNWAVVDTERGLIAGNDPLLFLNTTDAEDSTFDSFDPNSSGFALEDNPYSNQNGETYIFYAIA